MLKLGCFWASETKCSLPSGAMDRHPGHRPACPELLVIKAAEGKGGSLQGLRNFQRSLAHHPLFFLLCSLVSAEWQRREGDARSGANGIPWHQRPVPGAPPVETVAQCQVLL